MIAVDVTDAQDRLPIDPQRLQAAVEGILADHPRPQARISVAIVDDATIAELHARYCGDADPTDVLSFVLESDDDCLEGEVLASAETAAAVAPQYDWPAADELLLYVIHGMLHLVGYDDLTAAQRTEMRGKERQYLARFGLEAHYEGSAGPG